MSIIKLGLIGKSPPGKFKDIIDHLTRVKKKKPDLPDVFPASKLSIPTKTKNVEEIEAINRFVRDNPRQDMAGGGMLVQPGFGGTRQGYSGTSELDKATKYFTDGEFTKFDDIKGFKSDEPNFKKYKKIRDQIRKNIKYHDGKFVKPGTTQLVDQKTIDLENFLKNKKSIKQSVLIKKLEDLGYANPKNTLTVLLLIILT